MRTKSKSLFKTRPPHMAQPEPNENVWGNGCEMRGCTKASVGQFMLCLDGIRREFCHDHQNAGTFLFSLKYPFLSAYLHNGTIYIEGNDYVGKARNRASEDRPPCEVVQIGNVGCEDVAEHYLTARPDPEQW